MRSFLVAAVLLIPSLAFAHIALEYPPPRTTMLKTAPCGLGGSTRGTNVTTLTAGATITVKWRETINHPGHYRIAFDTDGQDFSVPPDITTDTKTTDNTVIMDLIADTASPSHTMDITLPNIACANCTLQVIQLMTDKPPYTVDALSDDVYYQCSDITLIAADPTPDVDSGGGGSGGGCGVSNGSAGWFGVGLIGLLCRARTRRKRG
jgi:hypothetical protein